MAGRNSLRQAEERSTKSSDTLLEKDRTRVHGWTSGRNFDTKAILGDSNLLEFTSIVASMLNNLLGIICEIGRGLEEDAALDVVDVCGAEKDTLEIPRQPRSLYGGEVLYDSV